MIFQDRKNAGRKLLAKLLAYKNNPNAVVLALPRGGVVTAFEVAKGLHLPLDIVVPRKIGAPQNPEFAVGAITEEGVGVFDDEIIAANDISPEYLVQKIEREKREAQRRLSLYRGKCPAMDIKNKIVLLIDDGVATGATMRAAILSTRAKKPDKIIVAVPVISSDALEKISKEVEEIIVLDIPAFFLAVGQFYEEFSQTTDQEVIQLMQEASIGMNDNLRI